MKGNMNEEKKVVRKHVERRVKLNDTYIKKLRPLDKLFSVGDSEVPGLRIYVEKSGTKTFYFAYKPNHQKNWVRFKLGNFNIINLPKARTMAKQYGTAIIDGKEPVEDEERSFWSKKYY